MTTRTSSIMNQFCQNPAVVSHSIGPGERASNCVSAQLQAGKLEAAMVIGIEHCADDSCIRMLAGMPPSKNLVAQAVHLMRLRSTPEISWRGESVRLSQSGDRLAVELFRPLTGDFDRDTRELDAVISRFVATTAWFGAHVTMCNLADVGVDTPTAAGIVTNAFSAYRDLWSEHGLPEPIAPEESETV